MVNSKHAASLLLMLTWSPSLMSPADGGRRTLTVKLPDHFYGHGKAGTM